MVKKINTTDELTLFPALGNWNDQAQRWILEIRGVLVDPLKIKIRKKIMVRILKRFMKGVPKESFESSLFRERILPFTANGLKGRQINVRMGPIDFQLVKKTKRNGHFISTIELTQEQVDLLVEVGALTNRVLNYTIQLDDERSIGSQVHLLNPTGISIVSDIDDTIKVTNVGNRGELLCNTFLREFSSVEGMAETYQKWHQEGCDFHYVSASPWQLQAPLTDLLNRSGFPAGSMNLRVFRWRDPVIKRVVSEKWVGKAKDLRRMVHRFPLRQFVLIGDSVERDPELYAHLAEEFQSQIRAIFIRQVPGYEMSAARIKRLQTQISETTFNVFVSNQDLPTQINTD